MFPPSSLSAPARSPQDGSWWDFPDAIRGGGLALKTFPRFAAALALMSIYAVPLFWIFQNPTTMPLPLSLSIMAGVLLVWLTLTDITLFRLPNVLVGLLLALGAWSAFTFHHMPLNLLFGFIAGGGFFWLLAWVFEKATGRSGLGMGDVKLLAALGMWVGASGLPLLLLLASLTALVHVAVQTAHGQRGKHLPFGPYLCFAGWLVILFQWPLWRFVGGLMGHTG